MAVTITRRSEPPLVELDGSLREKIARLLTKRDGKDPDFEVHFEQLSSGLKAWREPPKHGKSPWFTMPLWEWYAGETADRIVELVRAEAR